MDSLNNKLIRIERSINVYEDVDKLVSELVIDIPLEKLKNIVQPNSDDNELIDGYLLNESQIIEINKLLSNPIAINIGKYSYYLVSGGIYNW